MPADREDDVSSENPAPARTPKASSSRTPRAARATAAPKPATSAGPTPEQLPAGVVQTDALGTSHVLITGGTGFVGQAVLERLLASHPGTRVSVLVRSKGSVSPASRIRNLVKKPVFASLRDSMGEEAFLAMVDARVAVVEGSLGPDTVLPGDLDVVLHSASTVSFDPPIDEAFATNVGGATGLYEALLAAGNTDTHVVHVSTAYVGGFRKGVVPEASLDHTVDWRTEYAAALSARERVEMASRQPEVLKKLLAEARATKGKVGPQAVAEATEAAREKWVTTRLVEHGRLRAESLGWTDVYTLTKSFAERVAEELWAGSGHRLSVVRPSIIESAVRHPFPGWIDGFKVADPLILAYGRGQLPEFPGVPDSVLDVIPVDFVVNAMLAAAAARPEPAEPRYYHVSSGARNPLPFHSMYEAVRTYFTASPLPSPTGDVAVPIWRLPGGRRVERGLTSRRRLVTSADRIVDRLPSTVRTRSWSARLGKLDHDLASLTMFTNLYRAYVQTEILFDDEKTRALHLSLPEAEREDLGFDVEAIDWQHYLHQVHFPAITQMTRAFALRPVAAERPRKPLAVRDDVIAVFDFEGTVVESNLIQQYLMTLPAAQRVAAFATLLVTAPKYLRAERRDRGEFIRTLLRRYEGMRTADLDRIVHGRLGRSMREHRLPAALARVAEHRAAGHRTVLVTGALGLAAEPFAEYFDDVVASRMHERDGALSGYLAAPPLVDEARAAWLRRYAAEHGADLDASYGYGDSLADVSWLSLLGNPHAVNPDTELYRHAQRKKWVVDDWRRGDRVAAVTPSPETPAPASPEEGEGHPARRVTG